MFRYMERDADCTTVWESKCDFYIDFMAFHVFSEHPHLPHFVQSVHYRSF